MNKYTHIILSSSLFGSIYLFSLTYRIAMNRYNQRFDGFDAFNISIMLFSGLVFVNTGLRALEILNKS